jgi:Predicted ATPase (AAA+ superfamily)
MKNPFTVTGYAGAKYFCDREEETKKIISAVENGRNIVLYSIRRLGKTQLIKHVFSSLGKNKKYITVYLDIYHTRDLKSFTQSFAEAVFSALTTNPASILEKAAKVLSNLRVALSFDPFSGKTILTFDIKTPQESEATLRKIFEHISAQKKQVVVAIDEFQQVSLYPEDTTEALLRSFMSECTNASFIFSGSVNHLLISMFASANRPFYQSAEMLRLQKIETAVYARFAKRLFNSKGTNLPLSLATECIQWCRNHTYFVQRLFNRLYSLPVEEITGDVIQRTKNELLLEAEPVFNDYVNFYTQFQWKLLSAVAKEDGAQSVYSTEFINKYELGSTSSVRTALSP